MFRWPIDPDAQGDTARRFLLKTRADPARCRQLVWVGAIGRQDPALGCVARRAGSDLTRRTRLSGSDQYRRFGLYRFNARCGFWQELSVDFVANAP